MTSVSVRISQSELFPAVLHKILRAGGCLNFVRVSENICTICYENFHTEYGKCVATVPLFAETLNKEVSNVLCEKPIILVELLFELRIIVSQDSEDGKKTVCKQCVTGVTGGISGC